MNDELTSAFIGLGGNLQNPRQQVLDAFEALAGLPRSILDKRSLLYRSEPLGLPGQPDYVNAVALLRTALAPLELLDRLQRIEHAMGRVRDGRRWGPRVIDLDLLLYGGRRMNHPRLKLPHPELHHRAFVLIPLADVAPRGLRIPGHGPLQELYERCDPQGVTSLS